METAEIANETVQVAEFLESLTEREEEILALLSLGLKNNEIASELVLSINTVKWYVRQIYGKLGVENRNQAVEKAYDLGLLADRSDKHTLPSLLTTFIDQGESEKLIKILTDTDTRLLSLTGLGGIGKTRLAVQTGKLLSEKYGDLFTDGIYFVALASLTDAALLPDAIAKSLRLIMQGDRNAIKHQLLQYLSKKRMLLILDNIEHLMESVEFVVDILSTASKTKLLVTSREPLRLHAEMIYPVRGLGYPRKFNDEEFKEYPAVKLFLQRAQHVNPQFVVDNSQRQDIFRICKTVQGLPLAIELAAGWTNTLNCSEIADEIESGLDLLESSMRDLPKRHRSITVVFYQTWGMLKVEDREAFSKLSVFYGGFDRKAALDVANASIPILSTLIQKTLIRRTRQGKYEMHELIKQFAQEKLQDSGNVWNIKDLHARYFARQLNELENDLRGQDQVGALNKIEKDLENILVAWDWVVESKDFHKIDDMVESFYLYCLFRRGSIDGISVLKNAIDRFHHVDDPEVQKVVDRLIVRYEMLNTDILRINDPDRLADSRKRIQDCLDHHYRNEFGAEITFCLYALGRSQMWSKSYIEAIRLFDRCRELADEINDPFYSAYAYSRKGFCELLLQHHDEALLNNHKALSIARENGNLYVASWTLNQLADVFSALNQLDLAIKHHDEAVKTRQELGDKQGEAWSTAYLGLIHFVIGHIVDGERLSQRAIELAREINHQATLGVAIAIYSLILARKGEFSSAKEYAEKALSLLETASFSNIGIAQSAWLYSNCTSSEIGHLRERLARLIQGSNCMGISITNVNALPALSVILAREGSYQKSVEILALAETVTNRLGWFETKFLIPEWKEKIRNELNEKLYSEAWKRGLELEMEDVTRQFLDGEI